MPTKAVNLWFAEQATGEDFPHFKEVNRINDLIKILGNGSREGIAILVTSLPLFLEAGRAFHIQNPHKSPTTQVSKDNEVFDWIKNNDRSATFLIDFLMWSMEDEHLKNHFIEFVLTAFSLGDCFQTYYPTTPLGFDSWNS